METLLELRQIRTSYAGQPVLQGVDLTLCRHQILGLVGESGSGKSTTARVIAGLLPPDAGQLLWAGEELTPHRSLAARRRIQMVFQNPEGSLNPKHTVGKTLADAMLFHHLADRSTVKERCRELIRRMELPEDTLERYPRSFSGGQKQRIALARALSVEPELLIADEPTSALDVSVQLRMLELIRQLQAERELTILFISHDLGVIRYLCDTVAVMQDGRIWESEGQAEFFRSPRTAYGAQLLDSVPRIEPRQK